MKSRVPESPKVLGRLHCKDIFQVPKSQFDQKENKQSIQNSPKSAKLIQQTKMKSGNTVTSPKILE